MIKHLENGNIHMSLLEAVELQEQLAKSIAFCVKNGSSFPCTQIISMPMVLDNGGPIRQASKITFVLTAAPARE